MNDMKIAKERIIYLLRLALETLEKGDEKLSKRYVSLALSISTKVKCRIPKELRRSFCKKCKIMWIPGKSVRKRLLRKDKRIVYTCLSCGAVKRIPYSARK